MISFKMKGIVIILIVLTPLLSSARIGWYFHNLSFYYGGLFHQNMKFSNNFELQYEDGTKYRYRSMKTPIRTGSIQFGMPKIH